MATANFELEQGPRAEPDINENKEVNKKLNEILCGERCLTCIVCLFFWLLLLTVLCGGHASYNMFYGVNNQFLIQSNTLHMDTGTVHKHFDPETHQIVYSNSPVHVLNHSTFIDGVFNLSSDFNSFFDPLHEVSLQSMNKIKRQFETGSDASFVAYDGYSVRKYYIESCYYEEFGVFTRNYSCIAYPRGDMDEYAEVLCGSEESATCQIRVENEINAVLTDHCAYVYDTNNAEFFKATGYCSNVYKAGAITSSYGFTSDGYYAVYNEPNCTGNATNITAFPNKIGAVKSGITYQVAPSSGSCQIVSMFTGTTTDGACGTDHNFVDGTHEAILEDVCHPRNDGSSRVVVCNENVAEIRSYSVSDCTGNYTIMNISGVCFYCPQATSTRRRLGSSHCRHHVKGKTSHTLSGNRQKTIRGKKVSYGHQMKIDVKHLLCKMNHLQGSTDETTGNVKLDISELHLKLPGVKRRKFRPKATLIDFDCTITGDITDASSIEVDCSIDLWEAIADKNLELKMAVIAVNAADVFLSVFTNKKFGECVGKTALAVGKTVLDAVLFWNLFNGKVADDVANVDSTVKHCPKIGIKPIITLELKVDSSAHLKAHFDFGIEVNGNVEELDVSGAGIQWKSETLYDVNKLEKSD